MIVKLLEVTPNADELIYSACRQCYSDEFVGDNYPDNRSVTLSEKHKLIKHVLSSGHTATIEHVQFTFAISEVSRSLLAQLTRHRIASYCVKSQRYCSARNNQFVMPPSIKNSKFQQKFKNTMSLIYDLYAEMLEDKTIKKEDARYILTNAQYTDIVVTMNCRGLINFFGERCCTNAQWEIRNLANKMLDICKEKLPVVFEKIGPKCENIGFCLENPKRSCGRKKTISGG